MSRKCPGFTLIELVIASALAALLMLGVLTVLTGITRDRKRLAISAGSETTSRAAIADLLSRDLSSSTEFSVLSDGAVQLKSWAAIDGKTLDSIDRPSLITYQIRDKDGAGMLVRNQQLQDEPVQPLALRSLLACHVRQFQIERLRDPTDLPSSANTPNEADLGKRVSNRVRLRIAFNDSPDVIDQVLCLR